MRLCVMLVGCRQFHFLAAPVREKDIAHALVGG